MLITLSQRWWVFALRGVVAILFGIAALIWPQLTLFTLVVLFGAYALVDGILAIAAGIAAYERNERWWGELLEGVVGVLLGLVTVFWPGITALILLYLIGAWAIVTGILEIIAAIRLRRAITGEWLLILGALLSIVFGVLLFVSPGAGALSLLWLIAVYTIAFGLILVILAFRLRGARLSSGPTGVV
ncbi:MAG TPA: HdeD family acid-resistance protein [Chloroflexi bacterium]|jgi:uncharacterized membrane protein HdeD (DUF308 family)|nr:HdeD family acid-resistance protein [Chloroflexota bacterium]